MAASLDALRARLPVAEAEQAPEAAREIPWHAALLTGGLCRDRRIGGHTLNQSSAYQFVVGFNGAARDPLQHALPLVYVEPDAALFAGPDGLDIIRRIVQEAPGRLSPGGHLLLEISFDQAGALRDLLNETRWQDIKTYRDGAGHERVVYARVRTAEEAQVA